MRFGGPKRPSRSTRPTSLTLTLPDLEGPRPREEKPRIMNMEENEELTKDEVEQQVWSWGAGTDGQLGTGRLEDEHLPQLLRLPSLPSCGCVSMLACGGAHAVALTSVGNVLSWGRGTSGQLGHGEMVSWLQPKPITSLESHKITHVSAGWSHSGFVSDTGLLFTCGDGSFGQLGHGDYRSHCSPIEVSFFVNMHVNEMACGMRHSLVLLKGSSGSEVYAFGSGKRGQLGLSNDKIRTVSSPQITSGLEDLEVVSISANGDHSAALSGESTGVLFCHFGKADYIPCTKCFGLEIIFLDLTDTERLMLRKIFPTRHQFCCTIVLSNSSSILSVSSVDGHLYTWGRGFSGTSDTCFPQRVPSAFPFTKVAVGWNHALVLTGGHEVFMLGGNRHGVLSDFENTSAAKQSPGEATMEKVLGLEEVKVVEIAAGAEHSAIVTENGVIKTWGWGEHGQLGLENTSDQTNPQVVSLGHDNLNKDTMKVYCGSGFTFAMRTLSLHSRTC
ncbi:ultraviolet-B receptor UVR8 isoform X2 [Tripterygium wilfordii]|uniref:ultraviolet-B receptor UVR8 isoform X2 n=1 Tax=Tripterygium wilfordii TaxID=458696 RepID=UPI0018F8027A|nr:ultraviolet-B receptor UVR8 isoform X2 [Tripterygium wilfordii]